MHSRIVMFAVPPSHEIGPIEADKVARLSAAFDAQLELFHCAFDTDVAHSSLFEPARTREQIHQQVVRGRRELERTAEPFRARGVRVRTSVRWDSPLHEGIVRQVLRHRPLLLIAESTRRARAERLFLSHTDWRLIETCPCPLLLLKTRRPYAEPLVLAAVDPGHTHDKPAALDDQILDSAARLTEALSGTLLVFHARTPWEEATRTDTELRDLPEYRDEQIHQAYLARAEAHVVELAERHNIARQQVHVEDGHAAQALPRYAARRNADIVALGAVSRSRLRRAFIGHTAERVLDALDTDVLIVKPPGFHTSVSRQATHHVRTNAEPGTRMMW